MHCTNIFFYSPIETTNAILQTHKTHYHHQLNQQIVSVFEINELKRNDEIFSSERRHNCVILLSFITVTCVSQLPDDLSSTCASTCEEWAPAWCDHDWSAIGCVVSSSGVVKDYCRSACENCNGAYIVL